MPLRSGNHARSARRADRAAIAPRRIDARRQESPLMTFLRLRRAALCGAALFILTSCGERSPLGVEPHPPAPSRDLIGDLGTLPGLLSCTPLDYDSTTQMVGPWGGLIRVGPHLLLIPPGA